VFMSFCHNLYMARNIVKVSGGKRSFRIVLPCKIIKEMGWDDLEYVVVKKTGPDFLTIRRLFVDETGKRSG